MAGVALPDPSQMEFALWAKLFAEQFANLGIEVAGIEENWQSWAQGLLVFPELAFIPEPYGFGDWREWARRVLETTF